MVRARGQPISNCISSALAAAAVKPATDRAISADPKTSPSALAAPCSNNTSTGTCAGDQSAPARLEYLHAQSPNHSYVVGLGLRIFTIIVKKPEFSSTCAICLDSGLRGD